MTFMKTTVAIIFSLLIPSVSFAALNQDQANSLIAVVQSSTTTPASAFVPLITAFSNITVPQAESLINVVQQAPGVPANAFVGMLLAFTVDPVLGITQPIIEPPVIIPTIIPEPMPKPIIQIPAEPAKAISPSLPDVATTTVAEITTKVSQPGGSEYQSKNATDAGITYSTAIVKVWKTYAHTTKPSKVSVELYFGESLVSQSGYWNSASFVDGKKEIVGQGQLVNDADIGLTEASALTVELPVDFTIPRGVERSMRIETHPDNQNEDRYVAVLVELR